MAEKSYRQKAVQARMTFDACVVFHYLFYRVRWDKTPGPTPKDSWGPARLKLHKQLRGSSKPKPRPWNEGVKQSWMRCRCGVPMLSHARQL